MMVVSLARLKALSTFLALVLTFSVITVEPVNAAPKSKKASSRSGSKRAKAKSNSRSGRAVARRGGPRSAKLKARGSRRGGRINARGRGRGRGRGRWRSQVATSSHGTGVHDFRTQSWTQPLSRADRTSGDAQAGSSTVGTFSAPGVGAAPGVEVGSRGVDEATRPRITSASPLDPPPMNPLVAAYADSLATFGFSAENQGFIVTTLKGEVLAEHNADRL